MIAIKKIFMENFQSHINTEINFSDRVNVIIGQSDCGKTAIIRAIRWVLFNEPEGISMINHFSDYVRVSIDFTNNIRIVRYRSKNKRENKYIIKNLKDGKETVYSGFGKSIPDEVSKYSGVNYIYLDDIYKVAINFSSQHEGPFLLNESPSNKAAIIANIANTKAIEFAIVDTNKDTNNLYSKIQKNRELIKNKEDELQAYSYYNNYKKIYDDNENKIKEIERKIKRFNILLSNNEKYKNLYNKISYLSTMLQEIKSMLYKFEKVEFIEDEALKLKTLENINKSYKVNSVNYKKCFIENIRIKNMLQYSEKYEELEIKNNIYNKLSDIYAKLNLNSTNIKNIKNMIKNYQKIDMYTYKMEEIYEILIKYENLLTLLKRYQDINDRIFKGKIMLSNLKNDIKTDIDKYTYILRKNKVCPLCFNYLAEEDIEKIIKKI